MSIGSEVPEAAKTREIEIGTTVEPAQAAGDAAEGSLTAPLTGRPQLGGVLFRRAADLSATCGGFCGALSAQIASSGALRSGQHAGSLANAWDHR
jgi:hypothetical protein